MEETNPTIEAHLAILDEWAKDVFSFAKEAMNMTAAEPIDSLRGAPIPFTDSFGNPQTTILFDINGRLVYHDLSFYTKDMFRYQDRGNFKKYKGARYTWQQTVTLTAYNRAINTFDKDSFDAAKRWISVVSGHGIGKTATISTIALHFLICFGRAQIGATANSENQLKDIFLKELYFWRDKLPPFLRENIQLMDDMVRIVGTKDWFLRARVAKPDKPEALAGLHGKYVLILVDEASGVDDMTFEVMKGALTGENYIVMLTSNGTRTEGEFFESQQPGSRYTRLSFSSLDSPIVEEDFAGIISRDYGLESDEYRIRVLGQFASTAEMDDQGWIPLFANIPVLFEPERGQVINGAVIGVDPAGRGRDSSIIDVRDNVYLKEVLNEKTSSPPDLARKVETIRDAYNSKSEDIGIDAFGIGALVVANVNTKMGETVTALLTDKPRPGTEKEFNSYKSELGWRFRQWCAGGGIIITNNKEAWMRVLSKIKYRRDKQGRIALIAKETFKKLYNFSPDKFDAAIHTFFKVEPTKKVAVSVAQVEAHEAAEFMQQAASGGPSTNLSSM